MKSRMPAFWALLPALAFGAEAPGPPPLPADLGDLLRQAEVLSPAIRVTLPKAQTGKTLSATNLVITLTKDHVIYWEEEVVSLKELRERLRRAGGSKPVLIRADRHAYVDKLIELWDLCRDGGYQEVHIATLSE